MKVQVTKQEFITSMIAAIGYYVSQDQLDKIWTIYIRDYNYKPTLSMLEISFMYEQVK